MTSTRPFDEAVVFGAGAVGSFLGARLSSALRTVLVARGAHADAMESNGLRLTGTLDERASLAVARVLPPAAGRSLLLLTVKAGSLPAAAEAVAASGSEARTIVCLQNGLEPDVEFARLLEDRGATSHIVRRAITSAACNLAEPGVVEYWGGGFTFPAEGAYDGLAALFASAGIEALRSADFAADVWTKLAVNCVANPLCAILARRNNEVIVPELASVRQAICDEVTRLARSRGLALRDDLAAWLDEAMASSLNRNSMLQDTAYGRRTEVDALNGLVDELSRATSGDAPANRTLARLVRFLQDKVSAVG